MKKALLIFAKIVGGIFLVIGIWVGWIYLTNRTIDQMIAADLEISDKWIELVPDPPLCVVRQVPEMTLFIEGMTGANLRQSLNGKIQLPNGKFTQTQIEMYDDLGNPYYLRPSGGTLSQEVTVAFRPDEDFPENRRFTKIRIRSDEPFVCKRVFWRNKNLK